MIEIIGSLIAGIVVFHFVFRRRKPEPSKPKLRIVDKTLDPDYPKTILILPMGSSGSSEESEDNSS